ncbi:MlaE family ABC transporter permease [Gemmatimonas sp.]|jgi:phospholipid/cholesterol/gamma-HCH transport system permease protein|uniref:MlaE family ABC transporter permease n=1 Tax=Gemmatimonas sp. TaxID=1962908 RepID=UPI0037BFE2FD
MLGMDVVIRLAGRRIGGLLRALGRRAYFARDIVRGVRDPDTWIPEMIRQMRTIGVESVPLTIIVAAFLGGVTAFQTRYQLFPGVQLSVVGLITRQSIVLELGPLLTALVLTGRVGARMTAEIGTMRVTEQIDALETLSFDPVAYLALPRFLAGIVMLPALVILANTTAIVSAWAILITATDVRTADFLDGLRLAFTTFQVVYSLIKAFLFGAAISFVCSYEGYVTEAGAEGVGRSTALAVVIASVSILVLDALVAAVLAPFIQA